MKPEDVHELIRSRKSVYPRNFIDKPIDKDIIVELLESANWAPTHKQTEPWRFRVFRGKGLEKLSAFMSNYYKDNTPSELFLEKKFEKNRIKPLQSDCVIAIVSPSAFNHVNVISVVSTAKI